MSSMEVGAVRPAVQRLSLVERLRLAPAAPGLLVHADFGPRRIANSDITANLDGIEGIPELESIRPAPFLVPGHPLQAFIEKPSLLDLGDIQQISHILQDSIGAVLLGRGAIPAAMNAATHYSVRSWTRDAAMVALALRRDGKGEVAEEVLWRFLEFYGNQSQRSKFDHYHFSPDPIGDYAKKDTAGKPHPHAMMEIGPEGKLAESTAPWGHEQLDTIGWFLFLAFRLANEHGTDLVKLDQRVSNDVNAFNKDESILTLTLKFLHRIAAWKQAGRGPWEDILQQSRATELALLLAGVDEAHAYFSQHPKGWAALPVMYDASPIAAQVLRFQTEHGELRRELQAALSQRVPDLPDGRAVECSDPALALDSAMLWMTYPIEIGLTTHQERAVLRTVYGNYQEIGFRRRPRDGYVGQDYALGTNPHPWPGPDFADVHAKDYREAQWTLFDPLIAGHCARRYVTDGCRDERLLLRAERHLRRTLAMITSQDTEFDWDRKGAGETIHVRIPKLTLPEAYWYNTQTGRWLPNHNSPLLMANAAFSLGLLRFRFALEQRAQLQR